MNDYLMYVVSNTLDTLWIAVIILFFIFCIISLLVLVNALTEGKVFCKVSKNLSSIAVIWTIVLLATIIIAPCVYTVQYLITPHTVELGDDDVKLHKDYVSCLINPNPVFTDGESSNLNFKNTKGNPYAEQVEIVDDVTGKTIYESPVLEPGQTLRNGTLSTTLPNGTHRATAWFKSYDPTTKQMTVIGGIGLEMTIQSNAE